MMIELMLSVAPYSKTIQDLASQFGVKQLRFEVRNEECVLCGLCVRMCNEQMDGKAIGFQKRGYKRKISTPFEQAFRGVPGSAAAACTSVRPASCAARVPRPRRPSATPA